MGSLSALEALSGAMGSISLASWMFVLVPQLVENYKAQDAQGISLAFLAVWFLGDITNLIGATWAKLVPTVVALALYFCLADAVLILQCLYYNLLRTRTLSTAQPTQIEAPGDPRRPLLAQQGSTIGLPGSRRRSSTSQRPPSSLGGDGQLFDSIDKDESTKTWITITASVFCVCAVGSVGWIIAWRIGLWLPASSNGNEGTARGSVGAEVLGYISAVCYLGARIPQIVKNYRGKSCQGLSLLFFVLSLLGNATYGGGIIFHSVQRQYLITNLPWLIGSLGTMGEDTLIFVQFHIYSKPRA